jgi:Uma2 family endonuclease
MSTVTIPRPAIETLRDLVDRLGDIPSERIRMRPAPGTATAADVIALFDGEKRLFELVDGVLVEKAMGVYESLVAGVLIQLLWNFLEQNDLGIVLGADGALEVLPDLVRIPDVSFIAWDRLPDEKLPRARIPVLAPDLAVEVLSQGNTEAEMERKLREYFEAGVRLVWYVDPETRTARVYTRPDEVRLLHEDDTLDGGDVLPGFHLTLRECFDRAVRRRRE